MNKVHPTNWDEWNAIFSSALADMQKLNKSQRFYCEEWFDILKKVMRVYTHCDKESKIETK